MPNKPNAKKALRQNIKRAAQNLARKKNFREAIKKANKAEDAKKAAEYAREAQKALDKAAKTGVIKKNTAARKLSRLMKKIHAKKK
ncbi:MAG: 30S ribosomal protein S20 [Candidatus Magasanikbacteria bacterium CG10_big_fil_rev_8_21_14_0_10_36_32]|uniref:Small ribosomal subunit protein bS20 n=1 Tax=Candidatus Magasanikbacteria bacterium CG10_big_fil_rev_8_21_14_0_10_36_32 TaxID=1974646 RepID=A0A2M6W709_9BACT|nr:MAG: 30S ribosomal protein S20 [Candidatus Magasanikbacteria bacterium CG10_big_fil_rev_8_21_14_0_10_36_32]